MAAAVKKIQAQGRCARWSEFKSKFVGINVNDCYKQKKYFSLYSPKQWVNNTKYLCRIMYMFRFLLLLFCSRPTGGDLIAKSSITICENTGGADDPMSVVYEKACEKKLIVTMSVRSGQVR